MTFDEILESVFVITNRRDRVAETKEAIKASTLKAHNSDFFSKDIFETGVQFDTPDFLQSLDYYTLITNFRAFKYFKRVESATDTEGKFIEIITPDELLDAYGNNLVDIAYVAGRVLEIKASVEFQFALLGVYVQPIVTPETAYSSWVADIYPYAIIYDAARVVLGPLGKKEEAAIMRELAAEQYVILKMANVTDVGE